jgi:outer membrane lipoprotein SlyB
MVKLLTSILVVLLTTGCASSPRGAEYFPVVDMKGVDRTKFERDVVDCRQYARQRANVSDSAIAGAVVSGLLGALISPRGIRNEVAGRAMLIGAAGGAGEATMSQEQTLKLCLSGRGYKVFG